MSDDSIEERRSAASANGAPAKKFAANSVDAATSRDSVKAFRVLFPSGRQIVVRCEQTLKGREFIAMCREKYSVRGAMLLPSVEWRLESERRAREIVSVLEFATCHLFADC